MSEILANTQEIANNTLDAICGKNLRPYLIAIIILLAILVLVKLLFAIMDFIRPKDSFSGSIKDNEDERVISNPLEYRQEEIPLLDEPRQEPGSQIIENGTHFISQTKYYSPWGAMINLRNKDNTVDKSTALNGLNNNSCSVSCCSKQWPLPFKMSEDGVDGSKYVPNNYSCNNGTQDSGCLCMTPEQSKFLDYRGTNNQPSH